MHLILDQTELKDGSKKSVKLDQTSDLHEFLVKVHDAIKTHFSESDCKDPFMYDSKDPCFHTEFISTRGDVTTKTSNFKRYNLSKIDIHSASNWNSCGRAFGLILDHQGEGDSKGTKKVIHVTVAFFPGGCDRKRVEECRRIVQTLL